MEQLLGKEERPVTGVGDSVLRPGDRPSLAKPAGMGGVGVGVGQRVC